MTAEHTKDVTSDPLISELPVPFAEMADLLGVKKDTFRLWVRTGRVPAIQIGARWYCVPAKVVHDIARPSDLWALASASIVYREVQSRLRAEGHGITPPASGATPAPRPRGAQRRYTVEEIHSRRRLNPEQVARSVPPRPRPEVPRIVDVAELARVLSCSTATVYEMAKNDTIPSMLLGRRWRFDLDAVLDHLQEPVDLFQQSGRSWAAKRRGTSP